MFVRFQPLRVEVPSLRPLFDVERSLEDVFGGILDTPALKTASGGPALEIRENEKETVVVAEIPGVAKEDVKISVHTGLLTISGTRKRPGAAEGAKVLRNEIAVGTFLNCGRTSVRPAAVSRMAASRWPSNDASTAVNCQPGDGVRVQMPY